MMPGYVSLYKSKGGLKIVVKTLEEPPETRKFKVHGGVKKFKRVAMKKHLQEVVIVAKAAKKSKKNTDVTDDEIDELETVDDLEEALEEDEDEVEDDDDDEDEDDDEEDEDEDDDEDEPDDEDDDEDDEDEEDEKPKKKKSKNKGRRRTTAGKVGTADVAEHCGVDSRTLRMVLRKHKIAKDDETGRYEWPSLKDPTVKKIKKLIDKGEADNIKKESLDRLKEKKAAEKDAKKKTSKSGKKKDKGGKKKKKSKE
jgi:hypothetical protein